MKLNSGVLSCRSFHNFVINQSVDTPLERNRHNSRLGETWTLDFWMNPALPYLKQAVLCAHATTHNKHFTTFLVVVESVCAFNFSKKKKSGKDFEKIGASFHFFFQCSKPLSVKLKPLVCILFRVESLFVVTILCNYYVVLIITKDQDINKWIL